MKKYYFLLITTLLFIHLNTYAGQHLNSPVAISASGSYGSASGTLSDTYHDSSTGSYFYCGLNSGAILCIGQDAEGDGFGCFLMSSDSRYAFTKDIVLSMVPSDRFYISSTDSVCTSIQIYKDSRYAG